MGRGRAKAKQAKVARQLKYSGAGTDLDALRKELVGGSALPADAGFGELDDEYDELDDDDDDETDDEDDEFGGYGATSR
jgi:hypothetical protein